MSRGKDKSEVEHLKGVIRELQAENRRLKRQSKRVEKERVRIDAWMDDVMEAYVDQEPPPPPPDRCPMCGEKEEYSKSDLGNRILHNCKHCGYRKSEKAVK